MLAGSISAEAANAAGSHQLERAAVDSIRDKVTASWNLPPDLPGMKHVRIQIHLKLDRSGQILGEPEVAAQGGPEKTRKIVAASAMRAVHRAAPFKNLPQTQFDNETSSVEVILNFEPGDMAL